jgi:thiamine biosynthesis lipoprotein
MTKVFLLALILFITGCTKESKWVIEGQTMGTYYRVITYKNDKDKSAEVLKAKIEAKLVSINNIFSTYIKDSEISKLNQLKVGESLQVSRDFEVIYALAKKVYQETKGAFDITVGAFVNRWGFGPDKFEKKPTLEEIEELKKRVGFTKIKKTKKGYHRENETVYVDLSAIAKGYGVDQIISLLIKDKYKSGLVEIGGEVRAFGVKEDQSFWKVGIEKPVDTAVAREVQKVITLSDMAMATSGSYRNYHKFGNEVFSHTIDPRTGFPVKHSLISVTVLNPTCAEADAYATSLMVMGPMAGLKFAESKSIAAYFLYLENGAIKVSSSSAFKGYLKSIGTK